MKLHFAMLCAAALTTACVSSQTTEGTVESDTSKVAAIEPGSIADFEASVGDVRVYFDYDEYDIRRDAEETLKKQAAWLEKYEDVEILIAGNCDERGSREYNLALGARRAAAVKDYLVAAGVSADRINTISYGKEKPIDTRATEEAWSVNRNGHTQIVDGATS